MSGIRFHTGLYILFCFFAFMALQPLQTEAQKSKSTFICDTLTPFSPPELIVAAFQLGDCMEEVDDIDSAKRLVEIMDLDVIGYWALEKLYDIEDALNQYKQTQDYKTKLAQITAMRVEKRKHLYYSVLTDNLGEYSWGIKGFKFDMDNLTTPGGLKEAPPPPQTIFYSVELSRIPFISQDGAEQSISLPVQPDSGMSILRNKNDIKTIVVFKPGPLLDKEYTYYNGQCHCNRKAKEKVIKTDLDRVIIFNNKTSDVYWDVYYDKTLSK